MGPRESWNKEREWLWSALAILRDFRDEFIQSSGVEVAPESELADRVTNLCYDTDEWFEYERTRTPTPIEKEELDTMLSSPEVKP